MVLGQIDQQIDDIARRLSNLEQYVSSLTGPATVSQFPNGIVLGGGSSGYPPLPLLAYTSPPTGLTVNPGTFFGDIYADVTWVAPADGTASLYEVEWARKNADNTYNLISVERVGGNSLRIDGLLPNVTYGVRVLAVNAAGRASVSYLPAVGYMDFTTGHNTTPPAAPTGVTVFGIIRGLLVRWSDNTEPDMANGAGTYRVQVYSDAGLTALVATNTVSGLVTEFDNLNSNQQYWLTVRAINSSGTIGVASATATATTGQVVTKDVAFTIGGGNMFNDSSFEDTTQAAPYPFVVYNNPANITTAYDTAHVHSGSRALKVTFLANALGGGLSTAIYIPYGNFAASIPGGTWKAGDKWTFSVWIYGANGNIVPRIDGSFGMGDMPLIEGTAAGWGRYALTMILGADSTQQTIFIRNVFQQSVDQVFWVDDIQAERGDMPTSYAPKPDEILPNAVGTVQLSDAAITASKLGASSVTSTALANASVLAAALANNSVTTAAIAAGAVTAGTIAANAVTTAAIAANAITSTQISANAVTTPAIAAGSITTATLAAGAVTTANITAGAVTTATIAAGAVTAGTIAASAVTASAIAANAIVAGAIAAGAVTAGTIAANAVDANAISAGAVTTNKLAAFAVTANQIAANTITAAQIAAATITAGQIAAATITSTQIAAATITASNIVSGTITGTQIAANTIQASQLTTSTLTAAVITLNGGSLQAGTPPTTGLLLNSQGLRLYSGGVAQVILDVGGTATFTGTVNASSGSFTGTITATGGSFTGSVSINPGTLLAGGGNTILDNAGFRMISSTGGSYDHTRGVKWVDGAGTEKLRIWADSFLNNSSIEAINGMNFITLSGPNVNIQTPSASAQVGVGPSGVGLTGACYFDSWFAAKSGGFTDMHFSSNIPGLGGTNTPVYTNSGANQMCYNTSSIKLKENIVDLRTHASMRRGNPLWKLRPVWFKWKDIEGEHSEQPGLIAEEAWSHVPGLVHWVHPEKETKLRPTGRKDEMPVMNWDRLHVYIIEALNELKAEIDSLKQSA